MNEESALLTVRTVAALLGSTEKGIRARVARRVIPFRRMGGRITFIRSEVEQWLAALDGCTLQEAIDNTERRK